MEAWKVDHVLVDNPIDRKLHMLVRGGPVISMDVDEAKIVNY